MGWDPRAPGGMMEIGRVLWGVRGSRCFLWLVVDSAGFEQPISEPGRGKESTRGPELTSVSLRYFTHKENTTGRENANISSACD